MKNFFTLFTFSFSTLLAYSTDYYVNDNSTVGDVFCTAVGNNGNNGTAAATPKLTIGNVISTYALAAGDNIYIDAGTYSEQVTITSTDDGTAGGNVTFIGASEALTTISNTNTVFTFSTCNYVVLKNMSISASSDEVVQLDASGNIQIDNCTITYSGGSSFEGIDLTNNSNNNKVFDCIIDTDSKGISIEGVSSVSKTTGNEIYRCVIEARDDGAGGMGIELNKTNDTEVYKNRIIGFNNGVHLSRYNTLVKVYNNYLSNLNLGNLPCGVHVDNDDNQTIEIIHNSIYMKEGYCLHYNASNSNEHSTVKNNIMQTDDTDWDSECIYVVGSAADFVEIDYNQYYVPNGAPIWYDSDEFDLYTLAEVQGVDLETGGNDGNENSIEGNPSFNDVTATANDNLDVSTSSSALTKGETVVAITDDIYGTVRPIPRSIGAWDMIPLPVELLSFSVSTNEKKISLKWITASEKNNNYFLLEKSYDGKTYNELAKVKASSFPNKQNSYSYTDSDVFNGVIYYKLSQVDLNGSKSKLGARYIMLKKGDNLVRLTRKHNTFILELNENNSIKNKVCFFDINGQTVDQFSFELSDGFTTIPIPKNLTSGVYFINVNNTYSEKFVVH